MTMIPEDIMDICNHVELEHHIRQLFGAVPKKSIPVTFDFPTDKERLSSLMFGINTLVILQEAWQPPIRETIMYFQDLRHFAGPAIRIHILLTGKPSRDTLFTKTETADLSVWQHKINSLGDPNITLEQISMDEQHDE